MNARESLIKYARNSIKPEFARDICRAFNVKMDERLVYDGENRYREDSNEEPRVAVYELARFIAEALNCEPDEKQLKASREYLGRGMQTEAETLAYVANLPDGEEVQ